MTDADFRELWDELGEGSRSVRVSRQALDYLFSITYEELRRLASTVRRSDPGSTLNSTALVNEAWMKLARSPGFEVLSPLHFKRIAARAMRQLLVEAARRRNAGKRGESVIHITFDDNLPSSKLPVAAPEYEMLALNAALDGLAKLSPRQATIVEARYFGGLEVAETASLLQVSEATIQREWRMARAWLSLEMKRSA